MTDTTTPEKPAQIVLKNELTLFQRKNGEVNLLRNGRGLKCHIRQPFIIEEIIPESEIKTGLFDKNKGPKIKTRTEERSCGDWCPHFNLEFGRVVAKGQKPLDTVHAVISCSGNRVKHEILGVQVPEPVKTETTLTAVK